MLSLYKEEARKCQDGNLPPLPLTPDETREVTNLLEKGGGDGRYLIDLLSNWVEPGVSKSGKVKAAWLEKVARKELAVEQLPPEQAVSLLSSMGGGIM